jgi:ribonucleoside-diphosphate reductase alpha chain
MYLMAWESGLKTTYYLRSTAASTIEKSTQHARPRWTQRVKAPADVTVEAVAQPATEVKACSILNPDCEACQ